MEGPPELSSKDETMMNWLVEGLVGQNIFEFDIAILNDAEQKRKLTSGKGARPKSYTIGHRVTRIKKLMSGNVKECPNFAEVLRERLQAARVAFEARPAEQEPEVLANHEPSEMEYGKFYNVEGLGAGVPINTTPIWNFENLHQEPEVPQDKNVEPTPNYKFRGKHIIYIVNEGQHGNLLIKAFCVFAAFFNVLLCLARKNYHALVRALVSSSSPDNVKDFVTEALLEPEFVSEAMMANVSAAVHNLDRLQEGSHPSNVPNVADAFQIFSGVTIHFCHACLLWSKSKVSNLELMELISKRHIPQLPVHRNLRCSKCLQHKMESNTRVNALGFLASKRDALTKFCLNSVLTSRHYRRTIKVGAMTFRCRALILFYKNGPTHHAIILLVPDSGKVSDIQAVDSNNPFAPLNKDELSNIKNGHIAGYFYSRV